MNGVKRALVLLLIVILMVPVFLGTAIAAGSGGEVSRGQWISQLVNTFGMTVDDTTTMPDNYYSDMTTESPYYNDVLRGLRRVLRFKSVALHRQIPPHDLAVQQ